MKAFNVKVSIVWRSEEEHVNVRAESAEQAGRRAVEVARAGLPWGAGDAEVEVVETKEVER